MFEIKEKDLAGRIGIIETRHGRITTPIVFPVINIIKQEVPIQDIVNIGFNAIITNAYLVLKRFRDKALKLGIHKIIGYNGPIMTDSGAYQILQYGTIDVEPNEIVLAQQRMNSDIAVILDIPTPENVDWNKAKYTVDETLRRAKSALKYIEDDERIWVLPIQGGKYLDLIRYAAKEAAHIPYYNMYAIGSPTQLLERYEYSTIINIVGEAKRILPPDKPLHLFGAGHPMILPFLVALGVDTFDSASYILYARDRRYITPSRTHRLDELEEFPCSCPICSKYTPQEVRELSRRGQVKLLALHNLYVIYEELKKIRTAIREGRLWELLEERSRAHPSLYKAFKALIKYYNLIEKYDPTSKGIVHGIFLYSDESLYRPEIIRYRNFINKLYQPPPRLRKAVLIPGSITEKPLSRSKIIETVNKMIRDVDRRHKIYYIPFFNIIPHELCETYPLSQFEMNDNPSQTVLNIMVDNLIEYFKKWSKHYNEILIIIDVNSSWIKDFLKMFIREVKMKLKDLNNIDLIITSTTN